MLNYIVLNGNFQGVLNKMKKSELRQMIREVLQEELAKNARSVRKLKEAASRTSTKIFAFNYDEPENMYLFVDVPLHLIEEVYEYTLDMSDKKGLWLIGNNDEGFQCYDLSSFKSISDADAWCYNEFKKQVAAGEDFVYIEDPIFCEFEAADIDNYKTPITNMLSWRAGGTSEVDGDSGSAFYAMDMTTLNGDIEAYTMDDFEEMFF
jgi:hypothetical protein